MTTCAEGRELRQRLIALDIETTRLGIALALDVPLSEVWKVDLGGGPVN